MKTAWTLALILGCMTTWVQARDIKHDDWPDQSKWEQVQQVAEKRNAPIAVIYAPTSTTCPKCSGTAYSWMGNPAISRMSKMMMYTKQDQPDWFNAARNQSDGKYVPMLFFITPDEQLLAIVTYEKRDRIQEAAPVVMQLMQWMTKSKRSIEQADKLAERGSFKSALDRLGTIHEQDVKTADIVKKQIGPKAQVKSGESVFFRNLISDKKAAYEELGQKRLAEARKLMEQEQWMQADRVLRPMLSSRGSLDAADEAVALREEILAKKRAEQASR